jgi:hypothetical protein
MNIYNCGTSSINPITMGNYKDMVIDKFIKFKLNKAALPVSIMFIKNKTEYILRKKIFEKLPLQLANRIAKIPYLTSPKFKK